MEVRKLRLLLIFVWAKARSDEVCDVAGCLSDAGSIPADRQDIFYSIQV